MRKLLVVSLLLLAVVAVVLALLPSVRHQLAGRVAGDPIADGEPLRYWVYLLRAGETTEDRAAAARALGEFGPEAPAGAAAALAGALGDSEALVRRDAATALGRLGPSAEATPRLVAAIGDQDPDVRAAAADALGQSRPDDPAVLPALLKALGDPDAAVRVSAIMAVGRYGDRAQAAVPALVEMLKQTDSNRGSPHEAAVLALKAVGPAGLPALTQALGRPDARTRLGALKALGRLGPAAAPAAPDVERRLADEDPLVALEAVQCLWSIEHKADRAVAAARASLQTKEANARKRDQIRAKAIYVLGEVGPAARPAAPDLLAILKEEPEIHLRVHAARALGKLGPEPEIVQGLRAAARGDRDPDVCQAANEALKKLGQS